MKNQPWLPGRKGKKEGKDPSIILTNPKFAHNVGQVVRAASCFGIGQVWFTGNRVRFDDKKRLPREERMRGYQDVEIRQYDEPFDQFDREVSPVAIELVPGAESLPQFDHPERAVYVFGPEDGSLHGKHKSFCRRFVSIPTRHCTNLSAAVYLVLYDRMVKMSNGPILTQDKLNEKRWDFADLDEGYKKIGLE